jgi:hypothetical protein
MKLSVQEIKNYETIAVKYVRVGNDFRFAKPDSYTNHSDLVAKDETPISAGFFIYFTDEIHLQETPSTTLKLGPKPEDQELLENIFK